MHQIDSYNNQNKKKNRARNPTLSVHERSNKTIKGYGEVNSLNSLMSLIDVYQTAMSLFKSRTGSFGTTMCS